MTINPYDPTTPEWQLFAGMQSNELLIRSYSEDSERALNEAARTEQKASVFRQALALLDGLKGECSGDSPQDTLRTIIKSNDEATAKSLEVSKSRLKSAEACRVKAAAYKAALDKLMS
jgi:hypothetical protein